MVQLHVHLHEGFLPMLNMRRGIFQQALAVSEVCPQGREPWAGRKLPRSNPC